MRILDLDETDEVRVRLEVPFILEVNDEPVELTYTGWLSRSHYFSYGWKRADEGYQFLVLRVQGRNIGRRVVSVGIMERAEVLVDIGYIYKIGANPEFGLRPGEARSDYATFEILSTVKPLRVSWHERGRHFILDLRDVELEKIGTRNSDLVPCLSTRQGSETVP